MDVYLAWATGRPIFERLPECYRNNVVADYLTQFFDTLLIKEKATVADLPRQLNPITCDPNWLDFLAPLCGFSGQYWDRNWTVNAKRSLLAASYTTIWANKGSNHTLSYVLTCFQIPNFIVAKGDFIVGTSRVGIDPLGNSPWEYTIYLKNASNNTATLALVNKLNTLFGPCYCKSNIDFNDDLIVEYLPLDDEQLLVYTIL